MPLGALCTYIIEINTVVHWEYQAKKENELTVQRGDTVTLVDHHRPQSGEKKMVSWLLNQS